ncbi:MAG TPA: hypothetical protein VGM32_01935 [Rhodopila sp.]
MFYYRPFDQNRTILAGIPRATLLTWQTQLQTALINFSAGSNPVELSFMQGDGRKAVTHNVTTQQGIIYVLSLVNRCLGLPPSRVPMRPYFRN